MFPQPKRAEARLKVRDRVRDRPAYESLSDLVLAVRAKDGDHRALEALVERHAPVLRRLTAYLLADTQDAEDAAQEIEDKFGITLAASAVQIAAAVAFLLLVRQLGARHRRTVHEG